MIKKIIKKLKGNKKAIILAVIALIIVGYFIKGAFKPEDLGYRLEKVVKGNIVQEVSETGTVKAAEEVKMGFKTSGRISKIDVKVGDVIEQGQELASLETSQLSIQIMQARASLSVAQSQYDKLLAGSTPEEIKISQEARNSALNDFEKAYSDALNNLDDAYLKVNNAYNTVSLIHSSYFSVLDQEGIRVSENKSMILVSLNNIKSFLDKAKLSLSREDIDSALDKTEVSLKNSAEALRIVREMCEQGSYYSAVSSSDKSSLDSQRSYINTALSNITSSEQTISSKKTALQKAEDELTLKQAKPRQEDVSYYQAKVQEASANLSLLQRQYYDSYLRSPIKAVVTDVNKKVGEMAQTTETPITLISLDPLQIKVDIYEEDIVKVKEGNVVDIKIAALPNQNLTGKVVSVNPAEKIVEGVVYYETTIAFDEIKEGIKPGMTTDLVIKTANKANVLIVSKEAINENGEITVEVQKDGVISSREIQIGIEGNDNKIEIISGLEEGEEVVIR